MNVYRADFPADLGEQIAYVQAEADAYRAKLDAQRAASPELNNAFGELPDAHLARLQSELHELQVRRDLRSAVRRTASPEQRAQYPAGVERQISDSAAAWDAMVAGLPPVLADAMRVQLAAQIGTARATQGATQ